MVIEVDVHPLAAGDLGVVAGLGDQPSAHSPAPKRSLDHDILYPGVKEAVPHHVDEAHQFIVAVPGRDPTEAMPLDQTYPWPLGVVGDRRFERLDDCYEGDGRCGCSAVSARMSSDLMTVAYSPSRLASDNA